jgi:hypothetical protein
MPQLGRARALGSRRTSMWRTFKVVWILNLGYCQAGQAVPFSLPRNHPKATRRKNGYADSLIQKPSGSKARMAKKDPSCRELL